VVLATPPATRESRHDFGSCADAGEKRKMPSCTALVEALASGENTDDQECLREAPHPADIVGDDAEQNPPNAQPSSPTIGINRHTRPSWATVGCPRVRSVLAGRMDDGERPKSVAASPAEPRDEKAGPLKPFKFAKPLSGPSSHCWSPSVPPSDCGLRPYVSNIFLSVRCSPARLSGASPARSP